jgi:hypothetical protein
MKIDNIKEKKAQYIKNPRKKEQTRNAKQNGRPIQVQEASRTPHRLDKNRTTP